MISPTLWFFFPALFTPAPKIPPGFAFVPKPPVFVEYKGVKDFGEGKVPFRLRSAVISEEKKNRDVFYWIEHNLYEQTKETGEEASHIRALIRTSLWEKYWKNPRFPLKDAEEIWIAVPRSKPRKITDPEEKKLSLPLLSPGFALFRDFARVIQDDPTDKREIPVQGGKFVCHLYSFDFTLTDRIPTDIGTQVIDTRYVGLMWASDEVAFGLVKAIFSAISTIKYEVEGVHAPPLTEFIKIEIELTKTGQSVTSLFPLER
ncbi:MAG: hypothetical protein V2G43_05385 [bacterium JZ-2024 1]